MSVLGHRKARRQDRSMSSIVMFLLEVWLLTTTLINYKALIPGLRFRRTDVIGTNVHLASNVLVARTIVVVLSSTAGINVLGATAIVRVDRHLLKAVRQGRFHSSHLFNG